ncbi:MAG: type III secretion system chaperone [Pseudomonadota bacterium]
MDEDVESISALLEEMAPIANLHAVLVEPESPHWALALPNETPLLLSFHRDRRILELIMPIAPLPETATVATLDTLLGDGAPSYGTSTVDFAIDDEGAVVMMLRRPLAGTTAQNLAAGLATLSLHYGAIVARASTHCEAVSSAGSALDALRSGTLA